MKSAETMLIVGIAGALIVIGITIGIAMQSSTAHDSICRKSDPSCRIIRCERIVEEGGKKTCERWGE